MPEPDRLDLLRRLFSNDQATRRSAMDDAARRHQPLFESYLALEEALATLANENTEKGGHHNGQQRKQSPHQA